jgi:hypothetical protein
MIGSQQCSKHDDVGWSFNMCLGDDAGRFDPSTEIWVLLANQHRSEVQSDCLSDNEDSQVFLPGNPGVGFFQCSGTDCNYRSDLPTYFFFQGCLPGGARKTLSTGQSVTDVVDQPQLLRDASLKRPVTRTYSRFNQPAPFVPGISLPDPPLRNYQGALGSFKLGSSASLAEFTTPISRALTVPGSGFNPDGTPTGSTIEIPNTQLGEVLSFRILRGALPDQRVFYPLPLQDLQPRVDTERSPDSPCDPQHPERQCPCLTLDNSSLKSFCQILGNPGAAVTAAEYRLLLDSAIYPWPDRFSEHVLVTSVQAMLNQPSAQQSPVAFCFATEHKSGYGRQPYECNQFGQDCKAKIPGPFQDPNGFFATPAFYRGDPGDPAFPAGDTRAVGSKTEWAIAFFTDYRNAAGEQLKDSHGDPLAGPCPLVGLASGQTSPVLRLEEDPTNPGFTKLAVGFELNEFQPPILNPPCSLISRLLRRCGNRAPDIR